MGVRVLLVVLVIWLCRTGLVLAMVLLPLEEIIRQALKKMVK